MAEQNPTFEVKLPETGDTVVMKKYITTGQSRELQKIVLKSGTFNTDKGSFDNLPVAVFMDMQDKAAELIITKVIDKEGKESPYKPDWLYNLPQPDGQLVYDKINEVTNTSVLSAEERKN